MNWQTDKKWSDRFIPQIKRILGEHLIAAGDWVQDAKENSDLLVFELRPFRVACRIRRNSFLTDEYHSQFTIRASRAVNKTEMAKIMEGWGDYFFYGFADVHERSVVNWFLGDLKVFRLHLYRNPKMYSKERQIRNFDGSSSFFAWGRKEFPSDFVIAHGDDFVDVPIFDTPTVFSQHLNALYQ